MVWFRLIFLPHSNYHQHSLSAVAFEFHFGVHTFFMHFNILEFFDNILDPNNFHVYVPVDERETEDDKIKPRKHFSGIFINSSSINIENVKKVHHQSVQKISWSSHGRMRFSL